ncbi:hypothetical protein NLJ89_g8538 [Agrocybe chaxingu]|uniref:Uncharacterized protein n=1 Tax=Agrocybe chaxingu TaxID=84603 RepID=A0A9W8JV53_9AGAR|nr:hypothetical protein NLJ89_g8538 [Agrocybe chaxingu]
MGRLDSLAVLNIVLFWLSPSSEAQPLPEILSPRCVPASIPSSTAIATPSASSWLQLPAAAYCPRSGARPAYLAIVPTAVPLLVSSTSSSSLQPASTSGSDDDPSTMTHTPSPVAMVAGCLAGSIVIVAALLVFFVARRRKKRRRRMLHEVMNQSWAATLAARHSVGSVDSKYEEGAGTTFSRDAHRPSRAPSVSRSPSRISTSKKPPKSNRLPPNSSKTWYSLRHARTSLETEDLELSTSQTSISLRPSSSASATLPAPTIVVPLPDKPDAPKPGDEPGMDHGLTSSSASRPVSTGPSTARTRETPSPSQPGGWRSHDRDGSTALSLSDDFSSTVSTSGSSSAKGHGVAATTIGAHLYDIAAVDFGRPLPPTAEGETRLWKLGLTRAGEMDGGMRSIARPTARSFQGEFVLEDMPPAYADVR